MTKRKVLVTGMSGRIGRAVLKRLGDKYDFTALNRNPMEGVRCATADNTDFRLYTSPLRRAGYRGSSCRRAGFRHGRTRGTWWSGTFGVVQRVRGGAAGRCAAGYFASSGSVILSHILNRRCGVGERGVRQAARHVAHVDPRVGHSAQLNLWSEQGLGGSAGALLRRRFGAFGHLRSIRVDTGGGPSGGDAYLCRVVQPRRRGADD